MKAQRYSFTLPLTSVLDRGQGSATHSSLQETDPKYPFHRVLGGPQVHSGQVPKISHPPQFNPQTTQPVVSHYTNYAILAHKSNFYFT